MKRIDIIDLVTALENRIAELEKNPPELIPKQTLINMLESSIDDIIKNSFSRVIEKELRSLLKEELKRLKSTYVKSMLKKIMDDDLFKNQLGVIVKKKILKSFEC